MSAPPRRGIRLQIWPTLSEASLYICSSGEWSADAKSADEVEVRDVVLVARARLQVMFHEFAWPLIDGDAPDANDMLATSQRWRHSKGRLAYHCLVLFEGLLHHFRECTRLTGVCVQDRSRGAPCAGAYSSNRSFALRQRCPGTCPSDTRSQRLRQLVIGPPPDYQSLVAG